MDKATDILGISSQTRFCENYGFHRALVFSTCFFFFYSDLCLQSMIVVLLRLRNVCCGSSRAIPLHGDHTIKTIYVQSTLYLSNPPYIVQIVLFSAQNGDFILKFPRNSMKIKLCFLFVCLFDGV